MEKMNRTTVIVVRHKGKVAMAADGQVTLGNTVMKHGAKKVRRLYKDQVLVGFSGATADAFTLFERFEKKLEEYRGTSPAPRWNWPKTGGPTGCSAASRPFSW